MLVTLSRRTVQCLHSDLLPLLLIVLMNLTTLAAAMCPSGPKDCVISDVSMSGWELFNSRMSDSTEFLKLINVTFTSWPDDSSLRSNPRASQLKRLSMDRVSGQVRVTGGALSSLVQLNIANCCPLRDASPVQSMDSLQSLSIIGGCKIDTLNSSWIGRLPSLQSLNIDSARVDNLLLANLPPDTRNSLQEIRLRNNNFKKLEDDAFGHMPNLRSLILDGNIVQYIQPGAFQRLPLLRELSIVLPLPKEGELAKIWEPLLDGRFDNNTELETLRLVNARLAEDQIPKALVKLHKLLVLDLSGHRFRRLSNSVLVGLTGLRQLDLSNGSLACLFDRNFGIMNRLERLNLANNEIRLIGQRALLGLGSLASLDLTGNPIEEIEPGAFCSLPARVKEPPGLLASFNLSSASTTIGAVNLSEPCPPGFNPHQLVLSSQCRMPKRSYGPGGHDDNSGAKKSHSGGSGQSRHTFLIIIGLCVAFLIITVISMMAYKGWSKRKNAQLARDEEKELELQAMVAAAEAPASSTQPGSNGGGGSGGSGGSKKQPPNNGRHQRSGGGKSSAAASAKKSPSTTTPTGDHPAADGPEVEVVKAQVESPERAPPGDSAAAADEPRDETGASQPSPSAASSSSPSAASPAAKSPQLRPGVTLMTSVPEDSDLEARAITTLVVV